MDASSTTNIPLVDLASQHAEVESDVLSGLEDVFATTAFIGGTAVGQFEGAYAEWLGVAHCVGVANGTEALELALRATGVDAGSEVIIPVNTFIATAEAVVRIGAIPVFVDVDPAHLLIDPAKVAEAVTDRTRAIVPVHLFGQAAPVEQLQDIAASCGATIIEDAAQAQGATRNGRPAGGLGAVAGTSFYPGKNLGAAGDAGAVTTNDPEIAKRVRLLGAHGSATKYVHDVVGFNSRLDTIQAVVLNAKLRRLSAWNGLRQEAAARYAEMLGDVPGISVPTSAEGNEDVWHLYVIRTAARDRALAGLSEAGIGAGIHYPTPLHLTGAFAQLGLAEGAFPVAERAAREILSLPLYPHITIAQQKFVVETLRALV
ncbi:MULTISPECIES: DegT/DnrJ/EryC1/StrS aminotransferase family protein [Arthrobacter]|uniref:DegT/DnrJ/EryC1/StrS family aminotransferase n=1 Tax=Arthrobacter terricola TaxID=2547396 RepID=A0A4R5KVI5_9MICC|nr:MULTISPECIES: DegT/DnrJ/EryC1/StrS family aminotransferase [Arthrobacter]MBT8160332.1 DegT/DnrJ/EryC1/StrS family aminotransferase [Arthrobacter sp. GN70]TDF99973.1 DegT/DnrJ/EryC1/StrS family aminotransferase [Arthrobacter terricola]